MSAEPHTDPAALRLERLRVRFRRREGAALTVPELTLRPGDHLLVLGTSGSGKSTLLNALTGVVPHTVTADVSGEVVICGRATQESSVVELSRHIGVLAQDPAAGVCLPHVEQELALPLENQAVAPEEISDRIDEALQTVAAGGLRSRPSSELSGGEAQRVALAASLVARPDILLLDEPTSMLDAAGVASVRHALAEASRGYDPTVVMVEHRLDEVAGAGGVAALPELALVLGKGGEALAFGPTAEVLERHARELHAAGCWLPLETELCALTGVGGGLSAPVNRELLLSVGHDPAADEAADDADHGGPTTRHADEVVLSTRDLSVSRHAQPAQRRSRRAPRDQPEPILQDVTFDLCRGETVALLGANGSGKSTLLLTLAGMLPPATGSVRGPRPGLVFQNPEHQFVSHTVAGEIGHGVGEDRAAVVARQLSRHRLEGLADLSPFRLSGGEKRRLSIAAMLAHDRPALLLDEPTLGLDRRDTAATMAALRAAAGEGRAVLFASHDLRTVATLADRVVVLAAGRVVADGPVFDVLDDDAVLEQAGLELPPLLSWLLRNAGSAAAVRRTLRALDQAVTTSPAPASPPVGHAPPAVVHR